MNPVIYVATQERYRIAILLLFARLRNCRSPQKYEVELKARSLMNRESQVRSTSSMVVDSPDPKSKHSQNPFKFTTTSDVY